VPKDSIPRVTLHELSWSHSSRFDLYLTLLFLKKKM